MPCLHWYHTPRLACAYARACACGCARSHRCFLTLAFFCASCRASMCSSPMSSGARRPSCVRAGCSAWACAHARMRARGSLSRALGNRRERGRSSSSRARRRERGGPRKSGLDTASLPFGCLSSAGPPLTACLAAPVHPAAPHTPCAAVTGSALTDAPPTPSADRRGAQPPALIH